MISRRKSTKENSQAISRIITLSANDQKICKLYGITHEVRIKLVKLKPAKRSPKNMYKCHICHRKMKTRGHLNFHLKSHLEKNIFCSVKNCKFKCNIAKYLEGHMQRMHVPVKPQLFECTFCQWRTHSAPNLRGHINTFHNPDKKRFNCTECKFTTAKSTILNGHIFKQHGGQKPVQCSECSHRAVSNTLLAYHWEVNHEDQAKRPRPFKCKEPKCSYAGHTTHMLKIHMRTHTGEKPFKCKFCPYASTQRSHWKEHLRRHTNEKPYACTLCPYKCTTKCILDSHMRTHTGERPFACSKCKYRTTQRGHLNTHFRRYHTPQGKENKFECSLCQDKFYKRATLESHMTRHTGERPFKCRFCGRGLTQSSACKIHEKRCTKRHDESD